MRKDWRAVSVWVVVQHCCNHLTGLFATEAEAKVLFDDRGGVEAGFEMYEKVLG
jgi:hypothetical protein